MKKFKRGFTLIEVILFLGLTAALFAGIAAGVGNSVYQQRYSDAVQNYAEFLRSVYAQVGNVQSESGGRSNQAIYGKVMTFRAEETGSDGRTEGNVIKTYNLVGNLEVVTSAGDVGTNTGVNCKSASVITRLRCLEANVVVKQEDNTYKPVGFVQEYRPRWDSEIQTTAGWSSGYDVFEGIVIIARSPTSGNVSTYVWAPQDDGTGSSEQLNEVRKVIDNIDNCVKNDADDCDIFRTTNKNYPEPYETYLKTDLFKAQEIDFCLNPNGAQASSIRRDIRIVKGARNASGINILDEDQVETNPEEGEPTEEEAKMEKNRCQ